jgi:hypothetical protein
LKEGRGGEEEGSSGFSTLNREVGMHKAIKSIFNFIDFTIISCANTTHIQQDMSRVEIVARFCNNNEGKAFMVKHVVNIYS